jgi:CheY-like chemotaxis protein
MDARQSGGVPSSYPGADRAVQRLFAMRTIAVVEDNPSMLQGLNRLLSAHGFRVQTFTSAELFLENIAKCEAECLLF